MKRVQGQLQRAIKAIHPYSRMGGPLQAMERLLIKSSMVNYSQLSPLLPTSTVLRWLRIVDTPYRMIRLGFGVLGVMCCIAQSGGDTIQIVIVFHARVDWAVVVHLIMYRSVRVHKSSLSYEAFCEQDFGIVLRLVLR